MHFKPSSPSLPPAPNEGPIVILEGNTSCFGVITMWPEKCGQMISLKTWRFYRETAEAPSCRPLGLLRLRTT